MSQDIDKKLDVLQSSVKRIEAALLGDLDSDSPTIGILEKVRNQDKEIDSLKRFKNEVEPKVNDVYTFKSQVLRVVGLMTAATLGLFKLGGWLIGLVADFHKKP